ncbi:MAG TPA: hypothetical protein VEK07_11640 [Polyangiaceae bacterium]|nr:hypothetical protein [Polyangiaceae bacterium]
MRFVRTSRPTGSNDKSDRPWRHASWALRALAVLLGTAAVFGLAAHEMLLHCLHQKWLKRPLLELARRSLGVDFDYRAARVDLFSEADIDGLVITTPPDFRAFPEDLLRVGHVEAHWSLGELLRGRPLVERIAVSDVALNVVVDERGRTSFDALLPARPSAEPTVPLSRQASRLLATTPPIGRLDVHGVSLGLVRTDGGHVSEHTILRGLSVALHVRPAASAVAGWRADASLGSPSSPVELELSRAGPDVPAADARARLWAMVDASSEALHATLDLRVIDQTLLSTLSADRWLHAEAHLHFDPAAGRTEITLDPVEAADGAASVDALVELPDVGDATVRRARGNVDLARLLAWLPADLVPVTAEHASMRWQIDSLVMGQRMALSAGASLAVDADVSNLTLPIGAGSVRIDAAQLSGRVQSADGAAIKASGSLELAGARGEMGGDRFAVADVAVDLDGQRGQGERIGGRVGVRIGSLERAGATSGVCRNGHVDLRLDGVHLDPHEPLASEGDVALAIELETLDARASGMDATVDGLTLHGHTALQGRPPYAAELDARAPRLRVVGRDGRAILDGSAHIEGKVHDLVPDAASPEASSGGVDLAIDIGEMQASLEATKASETVDFALRAAAKSLKIVRPFLPTTMADTAPWDRMSLAVRSRGHLEHLGGDTPVLRQKTEVDVENAAFENVAARSLSFKIQSQGTALQHQADAELTLPGLTLADGRPADDHFTLSATVDRARPSLQFKLACEGHAAVKVSGSASFDPARRALLYETEGHLGGLSPMASFVSKTKGLDGFDLSHLEVALSSRGTLLGVVAGVARDGTMMLEPDPARTAAVEGTTDLRVDHLRWARGDTAVATPSLAWHAEAHASGPRRTLDSRVEVGTLHLDLGTRDVDLDGTRDEASLSIVGDLRDPEIELAQRLSIGAVEQDVIPEYPMGDVAFALVAERTPEGVVHISELKLKNGRGGTELSISGNVDLGEGRRTLSVATSATQDLARLSTVPERFTGQGTVAVEANVTSPNLSLYQVRAAVKGENVTVSLPRSGIAVDTANGDVPITVELETAANGVELRRSVDRSPYSMLRFADQHPLLAHSGFLSIARLKTPFVAIAPLVGNLSIDQNVVSLRQFEMGVRGGTITGQCGLDWNGPKSTLELHVRASGVQSSHGEPFDGNIAVSISAADRTIEGRAEILRIGERHLLDLLDLQDPSHVDPAMNRIRSALTFGYPDTLRLVFDHGFASAHLQLGGLARLISIGEIRGIPMGPIVDKMIASMLEDRETKESL